MGTIGERPRALRAARRRAGFTFIEVSIAVVVLLVGLVTAVYSQITAMNLMRSNREQNTAMADLETCLEQILLRPVDQIPVPGSLYQAGQPIAAFNNRSLAGEQVVATYPGYAGGAIPDPLEIRLVCTWNDWRGRPMALNLSTRKAR